MYSLSLASWRENHDWSVAGSLSQWIDRRWNGTPDDRVRLAATRGRITIQEHSFRWCRLLCNESNFDALQSGKSTCQSCNRSRRPRQMNIWRYALSSGFSQFVPAYSRWSTRLYYLYPIMKTWLALWLKLSVLLRKLALASRIHWQQDLSKVYTSGENCALYYPIEGCQMSYCHWTSPLVDKKYEFCCRRIRTSRSADVP